MKKIYILIILLVIVLVGLVLIRSRPTSEEKVQPASKSNEFNKEQYSLTDPDSLWVIVNKSAPLPSAYEPADLVKIDVEKKPDKTEDELRLRQDVKPAVEEMFKAAKAAGVDLQMGSGYRSYKLQEFYYNNYVNNYGQTEADKFSARPGSSEHQTGLALDIGALSGRCYLEECFRGTPEGQWLTQNAHRYGFIMRYPQGKESITGYQFEPWHFRFVAKPLAEQLNKQNLTMEEYFQKN